jgi:hypothetical protein
VKIHISVSHEQPAHRGYWICQLVLGNEIGTLTSITATLDNKQKCKKCLDLATQDEI